NSGPKLVPVSGVVTLDGKPLEGATVSFLPIPSNEMGQLGEDITSPSGDYTAMTKGRSGLVPGKYRVVVTKFLIDPAKIHVAFKDDPFMAQLVASGPDLAKAKKKRASGLGAAKAKKSNPPP